MSKRTRDVEDTADNTSGSPDDSSLKDPSHSDPCSAGQPSRNGKRTKTYDFTSVAKVLVGTPEVEFYVHVGTVCKHSKFFSAALQGANWAEKEQQMVKLPDDEPEVFEHFLNWLYTSQIACEPVTVNDRPPSIDVRPLIKLYIFAEKVLAPVCRQLIIARLFDKRRSITDIPIDVCVLAMAGTRPDDGLRYFVRDWFVVYSSTKLHTFSLYDQAPELCRAIALQILHNSTTARRHKWAFACLKFYQDPSSHEGPNKDCDGIRPNREPAQTSRTVHMSILE